MITIRRPTKHTAMVLIATLVIAACGGDEADQDPGLATLEPETTVQEGEAGGGEIEAEAAVLEFSKCMRENGLPQFPDPEIGSNGEVTFDPERFEGIDPQSEQVQSAFEACSFHLEGVALAPGGLDFDDPEFRDRLLALAQCLRDQGLDVDDPNFATFDPTQPEGLFGENFDPLDPDAQTAIEICVEQVGFFGPAQAPPSSAGEG